jgi:hypothetical protein
VPPAGLQPATIGLKGRCSSIELRGLGANRRPLSTLVNACEPTIVGAPPWSSGLGRRPFTPEIAGSNPAGGTYFLLRMRPASRHHDR